MLMKPEPVLPVVDDNDREFYHSVTDDRGMAIARLHRIHSHLNRRIERMERHVTSAEYDWNRRMNEQ